MRHLQHFIHVLLLTLLVPLTVSAANVRLVQTSPTTYVVNYTDFLNIGAVQVNMTYNPADTQILGLDQGAAILSASAQFSAYDNAKGQVNFGAITTKGFPASSGTLAIVTVGPVGNSSPRLVQSFVTTSLLNKNVIPPPTTPPPTTPPPTTPPPTTPPPTTPPPTTPPPSKPAVPTFYGSGLPAGGAPATVALGNLATTAVTGGSVAVPTDPLATPSTPAQPEEKTIELETVQAAKGPDSGDSSAKPEELKAPEKKSVQLTSILQRFRDHTGDMTPAALIGLFVDPIEPKIKQYPAIVYADGKSSVRISIDSTYLITTSPSLQLKGAKLIELGTVGDAWVIDAVVKDKGTEARILVQDGDRTIELPITVVPKIVLAKDKAGKIDTAEFARVIADRGNAQKPKYDFNSDSKHDAVDDFIYTANYIKQTGLKPTKPAKSPSDKGSEKTAPAAKETKSVTADAPAETAGTEKSPAAQKKKKK